MPPLPSSSLPCLSFRLLPSFSLPYSFIYRFPSLPSLPSEVKPLKPSKGVWMRALSSPSGFRGWSHAENDFGALYRAVRKPLVAIAWCVRCTIGVNYQCNRQTDRQTNGQTDKWRPSNETHWKLTLWLTLLWTISFICKTFRIGGF